MHEKENSAYIKLRNNKEDEWFDLEKDDVIYIWEAGQKNVISV